MFGEVLGVGVWGRSSEFGGLEVWRFGRLGVWEFRRLGVWEFRRLDVWRLSVPFVPFVASVPSTISPNQPRPRINPFLSTRKGFRFSLCRLTLSARSDCLNLACRTGGRETRDERREDARLTIGRRIQGPANIQTPKRPNIQTYPHRASSTRTSPIWRFSDEKFIPMSVMRLPDARYFSA